MQTGRRSLLGVVVAAVALLAGCGGGGEPAGPRVPISRVVVAGDSLADVGTFGARFTVQNSADPATGFPVFPEIVARNFGVNSLCNFFSFTGTTFVPNSRAGCTDFAVAASRVQNPASQGGAASPQSVPLQLATAAQAIGGSYKADDLLVVVGGANDSGDLLAAFLGAATGGTTGAANYQAFLGLLGDPTIPAALAQPNGAVVASVLYMQKLADIYFNAVKVNALDKGATHVAVLDMFDITLTPRVQAVLAQVSQANGGGAAGAAAAANVQAIVRNWTDTFNARLRADVGSDPRVAVSPFDADLTEVITHPVESGVTNTTTPACAVVGITAFGDPTPCTSAALDANPPPGLAPGWWRTWGFADGFHPSPFGHQLLAASVDRAIARAGWL